jgi:hypothetical protein
MALKRMSPTASLLRTSRLFSLPSPLPKPASNFTATANFESDTATLPYPTQQTIETTASSLGRGDWGLKRPLPRQSTYAKTTTPMLRIHQIDSIDHITDFDSAADHTLTLRKWQEMNLPVSMAPPRHRASRTEPPVSAFESDIDNTVRSGRGTSQGRWKFKGPWLAGKTEGEFKDYTEKKVKRRKLAFRQFLRQRLVERTTARMRATSIESGEDIQSGIVEISDNHFETYIKELRQHEEKLNALVEEFLDLPSAAHTSGKMTSYNQRGPPTTHPSAGLSYLRTKSYIHNHPVLGPMEVEPPVQGRVLLPTRVGGRGARNEALVGVGGVAADDTKIPMWQDQEPPGVTGFDPDVPGGAKFWVHPDRSSINSQGRIELQLMDRASKNTVAIYQGQATENPALTAPAPSLGTSRRLDDLSPSPRTIANPNQGYGLGDMASADRSGKASPLIGRNDKAPAQGDIFKMLSNMAPKN